MAKDGEPASEPLKTQLKTAVTSKVPASLTQAEQDSIVGDELSAAFSLPPKTTSPPPPVAVTVDFRTIGSADQNAIDAEFAKLTSADPANLTIKAINGAELDASEKTALIAAVKGKQNIFERLLKKNYAGLTLDESAAIYGLSEVTAMVPPGDVVDFAVLIPTATEQLKKEAFNFLNTTDPAQLTVKKADGSVDATLKDELVDAVKAQRLTEGIFLKLINKALTDADYAVTDRLGQNVKNLFKLPSKAERTFDTTYGVFATDFESICTRLEAGGHIIRPMITALQKKLDAVVAAAKLFKPADTADPVKRKLAANCLNPFLLEILFFSEFGPKFDDAVKAYTTDLSPLSKYMRIIARCCSGVGQQTYGTLIHFAIPDV